MSLSESISVYVNTLIRNTLEIRIDEVSKLMAKLMNKEGIKVQDKSVKVALQACLDKFRSDVEDGEPKVVEAKKTKAKSEKVKPDEKKTKAQKPKAEKAEKTKAKSKKAANGISVKLVSNYGPKNCALECGEQVEIVRNALGDMRKGTVKRLKEMVIFAKDSLDTVKEMLDEANISYSEVEKPPKATKGKKAAKKPVKKPAKAEESEAEAEESEAEESDDEADAKAEKKESEAEESEAEKSEVEEAEAEESEAEESDDE